MIRALWKNKKGSENIEAAIVLPIIILIIMSLIGLSIFRYEALCNQLDAQREALERAGASASIYKKIEIKSFTSTETGGAAETELRGTYVARITVIDEAAIIRGGELLYDEE